MCLCHVPRDTLSSPLRWSAATAAICRGPTNGWHCLAGHKSAITFALGFTETGIEDLTGNFGKVYKGLNVYGAKVVDERRKALAELYCKL